MNRNNSYTLLTFLPRYIISHHMRTLSEHISTPIRRLAKRFKRFARAVVARVRQVLKRVRGGVGIPRHVEEASICAPAITACCKTEEAETYRGLPGEPHIAFKHMFECALAAADRRRMQGFQNVSAGPRLIANATSPQRKMAAICLPRGARVSLL